MAIFGRFGRAFVEALRATNIGSRPLKDPGLVAWFGQEDDDTGLVVTVDTALQVSAVWASVDLLATTVAGLPLTLYRKEGNDREKDTASPLYPILHDQPNSFQTAFEFMELQMRHILLRGNFYAKIRSTNSNPVSALIPLNPDRVRPFWVEEGVRAYGYTPVRGGREVILPDEMFHVLAYPTDDGLQGQSIISYHRRTFGSAIGASKYGATFYKNGAFPGLTLEHPGKLSDEALQHLRESNEQMHRGVNRAHRTMILEEGMKATPMTIAPEDAQYIETMKFSVSDIARIFGVPPHLIADLERSTFSNIEQQDLNFVKHSTRRWTKRIEQAIKRDLIWRPDNYAEFNYEDLLKGDIKTRMDAYSVGLQNGIYSVNEVRAKENMNEIEGGDQHFRMLNLTALDAPPDDQQQRAVIALLEEAKQLAGSNGNGVKHEG